MKSLCIARASLTEVFDWVRENNLPVEWSLNDRISIPHFVRGVVRFGQIWLTAEDAVVAKIMLRFDSSEVAAVGGIPQTDDPFEHPFLFDFGDDQRFVSPFKTTI